MFGTLKMTSREPIFEGNTLCLGMDGMIKLEVAQLGTGGEGILSDLLIFKTLCDLAL